MGRARTMGASGTAARALAVPLGLIGSLGPVGQTAAQAPDEAGVRFGLGVAALVDDDAYLGLDGDVTVLPVPFVESGRFALFGPRATWRLVDDDQVDVELVLTYDFAGFDAEDADELSALDDRPGSVLAGIEASWNAPIGTFAVEALRDVAGEHDGTLVSAGWERSWAIGGGRLTPALTVRWQDARYLDAYYGVSAAEVSAGFARHEADAGVDVVAGLGWIRAFGEHRRVLVDALITVLSDAAADSPLTDDELASRVAVGWLHEF